MAVYSYLVIQKMYQATKTALFDQPETTDTAERTKRKDQGPRFLLAMTSCFARMAVIGSWLKGPQAMEVTCPLEP